MNVLRMEPRKLNPDDLGYLGNKVKVIRIDRISAGANIQLQMAAISVILLDPNAVIP